MKFTIEMDCDNDAFTDGDGEVTARSAAVQVDYILKKALGALRTGVTTGKLVDVNGNTVGTFALFEEKS